MTITNEWFLTFHRGLVEMLRDKYEKWNKENPDKEKKIPEYLDKEGQLPTWVYGKGKKPPGKEHHFFVPDILQEHPKFLEALKALGKNDVAKEAKMLGSYIYDNLALPLFRENNFVQVSQQRHITLLSALLLQYDVVSKPTNLPRKNNSVLFLGFYLSAISYAFRTMLVKVTPQENSSNEEDLVEIFWFHDESTEASPVPEYSGYGKHRPPNFYANLENEKNRRQFNIIGILPTDNIKSADKFRGGIQTVSVVNFLILTECVFHKITPEQKDKFVNSNMDPVKSGILSIDDYITLCLYLKVKRNVFKVPADSFSEYSELSARGVYLPDFAKLMVNKTYRILHFGRDQSRVFESKYVVDQHLNGQLETFQEKLVRRNPRKYETTSVIRKCSLTISTAIEDRVCITAYDVTKRHITSFAIFDLTAKTEDGYYLGTYANVGNANDERGPVCGYLVIKEVDGSDEKFTPGSFAIDEAEEKNKSGSLKGFLDWLRQLNNPKK